MSSSAPFDRNRVVVTDYKRRKHRRAHNAAVGANDIDAAALKHIRVRCEIGGVEVYRGMQHINQKASLWDLILMAKTTAHAAVQSNPQRFADMQGLDVRTTIVQHVWFGRREIDRRHWLVSRVGNLCTRTRSVNLLILH